MKSKTLIIALAVVASMALVSFTYESNKAADEVEQMVADWERAKAYTQEYINAASDEVIAYKPTPEIRSFGQQMLHIAEANYGFASTATGAKNPITFGQLEKGADQFKTKDALSKEVMKSYDFVINELKALDKSKMDENVKFFSFDITRKQAFEKAFEHQTHHRGQATVYLRMKGITPPQEKLF